jgi:hypothetical protein
MNMAELRCMHGQASRLLVNLAKLLDEHGGTETFVWASIKITGESSATTRQMWWN